MSALVSKSSLNLPSLHEYNEPWKLNGAQLFLKMAVSEVSLG
jgi:hypothetical protein